MLADRIIFVCIIVLAAGYFYATSEIPSLEIGDPLGPKAFPRLLGIALLLTAGLLFLEMMRARASRVAPEEEAPKEDLGHVPVIAAVSVWTGLYYAVFEHAGYLLSTFVFILGLMAYFHRGRWLTNLVTAAVFTVTSYALFVKALTVTLPAGILSF